MYDATSTALVNHPLRRRTTVNGSPRWRTYCNRLLLSSARAVTDIRQVKCQFCRHRWRMERQARRRARLAKEINRWPKP